MSGLFQHQQHPHRPQNVNLIHEIEKRSGGVNMSIAVGMTKLFQAMPTFWIILSWIVLWIIANATIAHFDPAPWPLLLCLASVPQLPLMVVIMVGQGLLGRHQELMANEQYQTTQKTYADIEHIMQHLQAQDGQAIQLAQSIEQISTMLKVEKTRPLSQEGIQG